MKTIEERAKEYASKKADISLSPVYNDALANLYEEGYIAGATEQRKIDIDKACNIFCHTGCPHKIDSYNCLNNKCDTWKTFRKIMEE